jgi:hypothetical protein
MIGECVEKFSSALRITSIHAKLFSLVFALYREDKNILIVPADAIRRSADILIVIKNTIRIFMERAQ